MQSNWMRILSRYIFTLEKYWIHFNPKQYDIDDIANGFGEMEVNVHYSRLEKSRAEGFDLEDEEEAVDEEAEEEEEEE